MSKKKNLTGGGMWRCEKIKSSLAFWVLRGGCVNWRGCEFIGYLLQVIHEIRNNTTGIERILSLKKKIWTVVYVRRVHLSILTFSLSSHQLIHKSFIYLSFYRFIINNLQSVGETTVTTLTLSFHIMILTKFMCHVTPRVSVYFFFIFGL